MQKNVTIELLPAEAADESAVRRSLAAACGVAPEAITGYVRLRQSVDARSRRIRILLTARAHVGEPCLPPPPPAFEFPDVRKAARRALIIGAGPAGLFAALRCLEAGIRPVILERGRDVRSRRRDLATLNRSGILDPDSNYCFGEGGAGTYSDGKLYTRSSKRGDVQRILRLFVHFGADERILYEAHPHIGTNKLPGIITAMRERIEAAGGECRFQSRVTALVHDRGVLKAVRTADGDTVDGDACILATGHSARDVFSLFRGEGLLLEAKPLAMGVRVEHPQALIDRLQYHCRPGEELPASLPPAAYQLVEQCGGRGVFSFCMCPGGIIATASTAPGELVVNGWSPSKRNNPYANSGMVAQVDAADAARHFRSLGKPPRDAEDPLLLMAFQQWLERDCYAAGGGGFVAPAQRLTDFLEGRASDSLPGCSYVRGLTPVEMGGLLPRFLHKALQEGFRRYGAKKRGYLTREAVVVATESRTSSPVRIPRDPESLSHPQLANLYPCGEGAGYAGGIVSAAMDGERAAEALSRRLNPAAR